MSEGAEDREQERCIICFKVLKESDAIVECPYCHVKGHKNHIMQWLKEKGTCPLCMKPLTVRDLIEVSPVKVPSHLTDLEYALRIAFKDFWRSLKNYLKNRPFFVRIRNITYSIMYDQVTDNIVVYADKVRQYFLSSALLEEVWVRYFLRKHAGEDPADPSAYGDLLQEPEPIISIISASVKGDVISPETAGELLAHPEQMPHYPSESELILLIIAAIAMLLLAVVFLAIISRLI
ncbi:MAG: RING finger domain-containing protein [Candidatus Baldrarchaeia archaeon]